MNKLALFLLLALMGQVGHSDVFENMGPGVWDQLERDTTDVTVDRVQQVPGGYLVTYERDGKVLKNRLCTHDPAVEQDYTEADRALAIHQRVNVLREAAKSKSTVAINTKGPWTGCIWPDYL